MIPRRGNRATGSNEVMASGTASVIHQMAIRQATARVAVTSGFSGSRSPKKRIRNDTMGPAQRPIRARLNEDSFEWPETFNVYIKTVNSYEYSKYRVIITILGLQLSQ